MMHEYYVNGRLQKRSKSFMSLRRQGTNVDSNKSKTSSDSGINTDIDPNFRSLKIKVFKNGDDTDSGTEIAVSRKLFRHWLKLLDHVTTRLDYIHPVHMLCDFKGQEIKDFTELEDEGLYVACDERPFKDVDYGGNRAKEVANKKWQKKPAVQYLDPKALDSSESIEIYMQNRGFQSRSGRAYPDDGIKSPRLSARSPRPPPSPKPKRRISKTKKKRSPRKKASSRSPSPERTDSANDSKDHGYGSGGRRSYSPRKSVADSIDSYDYDKYARRSTSPSHGRRSHSPAKRQSPTKTIKKKYSNTNKYDSDESDKEYGRGARSNYNSYKGYGTKRYGKGYDREDTLETRRDSQSTVATEDSYGRDRRYDSPKRREYGSKSRSTFRSRSGKYREETDESQTKKDNKDKKYSIYERDHKVVRTFYR